MTLPAPGADARIEHWLAALEARHLADLRLAEVGRALRALSSAYVERRGRLARGAALDGAGKRAAFALFYGPLHLLTVRHIATALGAAHGPGAAPPPHILDVGCGTGAVGAAWALATGGHITGLDRHPWAVDEARWTYRTLGLEGDARQADLARFSTRRVPDVVVAGYTLNELDPEVRESVGRQLNAWAARGTGVLVIEPIARGIAPWMAKWASAAGSRVRHDEWRFALALPDIVRRLELASGLNRQEVTARTLYWPPFEAQPEEAR